MDSPDRIQDARRYFIGIGVGNYDDASLNLAKAESDVVHIAEWFTTTSGVPHVHALSHLGKSPTSDEILASLRQFLLELGERDVIVIYVACHGELEGARAHLFGRNTPRKALAGLSIDASTLGAILGQSKPHNLLLIVDACVAGRLAIAIQRAAEDASEHEGNRDPHLPHAQVVVASAFGRDPALDGRFAEAFLRVVNSERWTGTASRWIAVDQLINGLKEELQDLGAPQVAEGRYWGTGAAELIPNPNVATRQSRQPIADEEFEAHFDPSSRGVGRGEGGSFFTGRARELRRIVAWLGARHTVSNGTPDGAQSPPSLIAITGSPGSGKSALLSRIAVLADSTRRPNAAALAALGAGTVPPQNALDGVVWCHNKNERQIVEDLANALGGSASTTEGLLQLATGRQATFAIDALDEVQAGQARQVAHRVLKPLAALPGIRLIVATRRRPVRDGAGGQADLLDHLGAEARAVIDLDVAPDMRVDMRDYVEARIHAISGGKDADADRVVATNATALAERIANAAGNSFLVAAIAARSAVAAGPARADGGYALPTEVGEALAGYIQRLPDPRKARGILRPLAWSQGAGLPWATLWPKLATALAVLVADGDAHYDDGDVRALLDGAGDLVIESMEAGQPVYRLFHEALAEHLRADTDEGQSHAAIASAMLELIGDRQWPQVLRYITTNLPWHLLQAGRIDELVAVLADPTWDRAVREQNRDPLAAATVADAAIARILDAAPTDLRVVPLCVLHSRAVTTAPPLLLDVLARSGQLARAEMMANNLTFTPDRMLAYRHLCAAHARARDASAARRCAEEVRRSLPAMPAVHQPMAWCWAAEAAQDAALPDAAHQAAKAAVEAAFAIEGDGWDLPNGYFWAARACRLVGLSSGIARLRDAIDALEVTHSSMMGRNQPLQAASATAHTALLHRRLAEFVRAKEASQHGIIRDGNIALALAAAGMNSEADQVFAAVGDAAPRGEQDSIKRWVWALALNGRSTDALAALEQMYDPVEQGKAIARVADVAIERDDKPTLAALPQIIRPLIERLYEARARARLIRTLWLLGEQAEALQLAEVDIATQHRSAPVADPRDGPGPHPLASAAALDRVDRAKTSRREMPNSVVPVADSNSAQDAMSAAREGRLDEARDRLATIRVPLYRARSLAAIAKHDPQADTALASWLRAMANARHAGRGAVDEIRPLGDELLARTGRHDDAKSLDALLRRLDAQWELESFCEQYEGLRRTVAPSAERTRRLDALLHVSRRLAGAHSWTRADIEAGWNSAEDGKRLFVIGLMQADPRLAVAQVLADAIRGSRSAFEQYHALRAASMARLRGKARQIVQAAIESEVQGTQRSDGVDSDLAADPDRLRVAREMLKRARGRAAERRT